MSKYIVINGSFRPDDNNASFVAAYDDIESARNCCNVNIAEDFGYDSYEDFLEEEFPTCSNDAYGVLYSIRYDVMEHQEVYKVYEIR